jgi:hypothetical protein
MRLKVLKYIRRTDLVSSKEAKEFEEKSDKRAFE